jgi:hypothetical protein
MPVNQEIGTPIPGVDSLTYEQMNVITEYQRLWMQIASWMRAFFKSSLEDSADLAAVTARLFEIPIDFYNAFRPYFTEEQSTQLYNIVYRLVYNNYELINAYKANDRVPIDASTIDWYQGASELAAFLASVNIYWDQAILDSLLFSYGKLKIEEIIAYYNQEYQKEINIYNTLEDSAVLIGSYMARGIIAREASIGNITS